MSVYVQIGAGAGDLDSRANFKDSFTEYIKKLKKETIEEILLVEPNPANIEKLKQCWSNYPQAKIVQVGICTKNNNNSQLAFYYALDDAPHFQVCSLKKEHVLQHYPNANTKTFEVTCYDIETLIKMHLNNKHIEILALDVEGMDADIILDTEWEKINCSNICFEVLHLGPNINNVKHHLNQRSFFYTKNGLDNGQFDHLYTKQ